MEERGFWGFGFEKQWNALSGAYWAILVGIWKIFVAKTDLNCADLTQEVSVEENFSVLLRDFFCGILVKNVAAFCLCLRVLPEAKVKRLRLIALTKEVSKKPSRDIVLWLSLTKTSLNKHSKPVNNIPPWPLYQLLLSDLLEFQS